MMASFVPLGQFEQLKAQLEDTQESLGAALARIEVFRLREKALSAEIAKLRLGQPVDGATQASTSHGVPADMVSSAEAAQALPGQTDTSTPQFVQQEQPDKQQSPNQQMPKWPIPCYVTEIEGNLPVMLITSSSRQTPGSVVITKEYVDFVEVRARIKRHDFVGFAAAPKAHSRRSQTPSSFSATWKQFLPCLASEPSSPTHRSPRVAAAEWSKGASEGGTLPMSTADSAAGHRPHSDGGALAAAPQASVVELSAATAVGSADSRGQLRSQAWDQASTSGSSSPALGGLSAKTGHNRSAPQSSSIAWQSLQDTEMPGTGVWQILWRSGGMQQRLTFQATQETREFLHKHTARWLDSHSCQAGEELDVQVGAAAAAAGSQAQGSVELAMPRHLMPGTFTPRLSEQSSILTGDNKLNSGAQCIAAALPARYQSKDWQLVYSTARHGISLQTLYRKAAGVPGTVLLVRDAGGYVFGAFCTEPWRPSPRFFGTGETFVFQLEPHKVMYPWKTRSAMKNDFFMYAQHEALGVGGLGSFAIWLDSELLQGSSGSCGTFGSSCLASKEEFKVAAVEIWALV